jgi:hypothetical protein
MEELPVAPEKPAGEAAEPGRKASGPVPVVEAEEGFEIEEAYASPPTQISEAPPPRSPESGAVPVAQFEEDFELERPGGAESAAATTTRPAPEGAAPTPPEAAELHGAAAEEAAAAPPAEPAAPVPPEVTEALPDLGTETVAVPALAPPTRRAPPARLPKSRVAEISPEHAAAAMADLAGGGKTTPLTSSTLAELYVSQGAPEKAIEIYEKVVAETPGDEKAVARLAALKAAVEPPAGTARLSPRDVRRAAVEATIKRLEAFLAAIRERKASL